MIRKEAHGWRPAKMKRREPELALQKFAATLLRLNGAPDVIWSEHAADVEKIIRRCVVSGDCLEWTGAKNHPRGYGVMKSKRLGRVAYVHRLMLEAMIGPLAKGLYACHRCDNPVCVSPWHLFAGTPKDNVDDCIAKGRHVPPPVTDWPQRMRGGRHHWQKLSRSDIPTIRSRIAQGERPSVIAADYGVSQQTISNIKLGRRWAHV